MTFLEYLLPFQLIDSVGLFNKYYTYFLGSNVACS